MTKDHELVSQIIKAIGDSPTREGVQETPDRVVRSWKEMYSGYGEDPASYLSKQFTTDSTQMVCINDIDFFSTCEHHMLPFFGTVDIAYVPVSHVVGLSKFARVVNALARRLQIQERLTTEIADVIDRSVPNKGVAVRVRSQHLCMMARGIKSPRSKMLTTALRGCFYEPEVRAEWLSLVPRD